jgi:hypothetical protein
VAHVAPKVALRCPYCLLVVVALIGGQERARRGPVADQNMVAELVTRAWMIRSQCAFIRGSRGAVFRICMSSARNGDSVDLPKLARRDDVHLIRHGQVTWADLIASHPPSPGVRIGPDAPSGVRRASLLSED